MEETELQSLERFVAENDELLALEEQIGRFNIFDALGVARVEIRHSNYLAWLLTPGESHGLGDLFLKALLMDILRKARQQEITPPVSPVELDGADLGGVEVRREWRNIDLLITCEEPRFVIAIENKIDSGEHGNQLQKYEDIVGAEFPETKPLYVFLTLEGEDASDPDWVSYSYADLHKTIVRTRRTNQGALGGDVAVFLEHYLSLIGNRFMENEEIDRLCRQIYSNHRRAMDLIWERVGSPASGLVGGIQQWIQQRPNEWMHIKTKQREVEFIPTSWDAMLAKVGKRPTFEPQHWITMRLFAGSTYVRLFVIVCPTKDPIMRKTVLERLLNDKSGFGFSTKKKELTEDWTRVLSEKICTLNEEEEPDIDAVMEKIVKRLAKFLEETALLPDALKDLRHPAA